MFYVDLPVIGDAWKNVGTFSTHKEAVDFCVENFGANDKGEVALITGDEDEQEEDDR